MNTHWPPSMTCAGLLLYFILLLPPLKHALESSMTVQMLVQIPLLITVGLLLSRSVPAQLNAALARWDLHGISGLVLATLVMALWMLPRLLDASLTEPSIAIAKYLSIPLLIGLPFALSWPRMSFIVRGVFLLELIATFFRMGWLYMIWPGRLCSNYLLDDQQRLGNYMVLLGGLLLLWTAYKLLWGTMETFAEAQPRHAAKPGLERLDHHDKI